jgi:hypothetical protein
MEPPGRSSCFISASILWKLKATTWKLCNNIFNLKICGQLLQTNTCSLVCYEVINQSMMKIIYREGTKMRRAWHWIYVLKEMEIEISISGPTWFLGLVPPDQVTMCYEEDAPALRCACTNRARRHHVVWISSNFYTNAVWATKTHTRFSTPILSW